MRRYLINEGGSIRSVHSTPYRLPPHQHYSFSNVTFLCYSSAVHEAFEKYKDKFTPFGILDEILGSPAILRSQKRQEKQETN